MDTAEIDYNTFDARVARSLMPSKKLEANLRKALDAIYRAAAADKKCCPIPHDLITADNDGAYDPKHPRNKPLVDELVRRGFDVRPYYECRAFVDSGLMVCWD